MEQVEDGEGKHFTKHHYIDRDSGEVRRKYAYKRRPCNRLVLTSKVAATLAGYTLIEKDLRSCLEWLDEIERRHDERPAHGGKFGHGKDRSNYVIIKGLFVATLAFYAKCFTRCEGRKLKLDRAQLDEAFHASHDAYMSYRHNFAAHSGAERLEAAHVVAVFPDPKKGRFPMKIFRELNQPDVLFDESDTGFRALIAHVKTLVDAKIDQLTRKVQNEDAPDAISKLLEKK